MAFASCLPGHFIFPAGSYVDPLYDSLRRRFAPKGKARAYQRARELKECALGDPPEAPVMNTFQWAQAIVQVRNPPALMEVRRHEADSRFFEA